MKIGYLLAGGMLAFSTSALASETIIYTYDELGRLVRTTQTGSVNNGVVTDIDYDPAGNRTDYDVNGSNGSGNDDGVTGTTGSGAGETPPSFSINSASATEGQALTFTVTKNTAKIGGYAVNWSTVDGTATSGTDYDQASGVLTFSGSELSKTIVIATIDDGDVEGDETFDVNLDEASNGATISTGSGTGTITDNDIANSPPNAVNDSGTVGACMAVNIDVRANDSDPDGDTPLTVVSVSPVTPASMGQASVVSASTVSFSSFGPTGGASFTYTIEDSEGALASAIVAITVNNSGPGCQ